MKINYPVYEVELARLAELGFPKEKKNLKLLAKSGGNLEAVIDFLIAKNTFGEKCREVKMAMKVERKLLKECKKKEKFSAKAFKHARKNEKKFEKRKPRVTLPDVPLLQLEGKSSTWPTSIDSVFLDGNNMLYVASAIRKLALVEKDSAEAALVFLAKKFHQVLKVKVTVMFDDSRTTLEEGSFFVLRARPNFPTSDDALVEISKTLEDKKKALFISSDRELLHRLESNGVLLCKPKEWMKFAASRIREADPNAFLGVPDDMEAVIDRLVKMMYHPNPITSTQEMEVELQNKLTL